MADRRAESLVIGVTLQSGAVLNAISLVLQAPAKK